MYNPNSEQWKVLIRAAKLPCEFADTDITIPESLNNYFLDESKKAKWQHELGIKFLSGSYKYGVFPEYKIKEGELLWKLDPFSKPTWEWLHHQFIFIKYLCAAYEKTNDAVFLDKINDLITDWYSFNSQIDSDLSKFSWNDHSTAYRLDNLIYYYIFLSKNKPSTTADDLLIFLIHLHVSILLCEDFYSEGTNHGFDQSCILCLALTIFPASEVNNHNKKIATSRLKNEISSIYSVDGIHKENSPSYHIWQTSALFNVLKYLSYLDSDGFISQKVVSAINFIKYLLKPDLSHPLIGDSQIFKLSADFFPSNFFDEELKYIFSKSSDGVVPKNLDFISENSGYVILRNGWNFLNSNSCIHFVFKSSYLAEYHRQDDDLNILINAFGEDYLVDCGRHGYNEKSENRIFARSNIAHNVPCLRDVRPRRNFNLLNKGSRVHVINNSDNFIEFEGVTSIYEGFQLSRTVYYDRMNSFFVTDELRSITALVSDIPWFTNLIIDGDKTVQIENDTITVTGSNGLMRICFDRNIEPYTECCDILISLSDSENRKGIRLKIENFSKLNKFKILFESRLN